MFDGFRLEGLFEQSKGRQIELLKIYRKSIVSGFTDVEQALIAIADTTERERLQQQVVTPRGAPSSIAETRLREGTVDLVTVLHDPADAVHGRGQPCRGTAGAPAGRLEPLSGAWRQLVAAGAQGHCDQAAMTTRRTIVLALVCLVLVAGIVGYWAPWQTDQAQQQQKAGKGAAGSRPRGNPSTDPVPVLAIDARTTDVPVYLDGVGTARRSTP